MQVTSERRKREMSGLQNAEKILKGRRGGGWFFSKRRIPRRCFFRSKKIPKVGLARTAQKAGQSNVKDPRA